MSNKSNTDTLNNSSSLDSLVKQDPTTAAKNNPCPVCRATMTPPPCRGHGGVGGSDGDEMSEEQVFLEEVLHAHHAEKAAFSHDDQATRETAQQLSEMESSKEESHNFDSDILSELLSNKLLHISNDFELGILTLRLLCHPDVLTNKQRKELENYIKATLELLEIYKKENNLSNKCHILDTDVLNKNPVMLRILMPTHAHYVNFMKHLIANSMLPKQNHHQTDKAIYPVGENHFKPYQPHMRPMPGKSKKRNLEEEKEAQMKSPLMRLKSYLDGLKRS